MAETKKKPAAKKPAPKKTTGNASAKKPAASAKKPAAKAAPAKKSTTTTTPKASTNSSAKKSTASSSAKKSTASANNNSSTATSPPQLSRQEQKIQDLLAEGTCHLPGNGWWQDWWMHLSNGHPLLSVCFQHRLNPVTKSMRFVQLLASVAMGLIITNILYIAFIHDNKQDELVSDITKQDAANMNWSGLSEHEKAQIEKYTTVQLSAGMAFLWTVGSALQAIFDSSMFYVTTCACCKCDTSNPRMAKLKSVCNTVVVVGVIVVMAVASMSIILRANVEGGGEVKVTKWNNQTDSFERETISNKDNYEFMLSFALELAFSWFVWFPIFDIIMFSGVLARWKCCICLGGGRPADLEAQGDVEQGRSGRKK